MSLRGFVLRCPKLRKKAINKRAKRGSEVENIEKEEVRENVKSTIEELPEPHHRQSAFVLSGYISPCPSCPSCPSWFTMFI